jgi:hypothetical protein
MRFVLRPVIGSGLGSSGFLAVLAQALCPDWGPGFGLPGVSDDVHALAIWDSGTGPVPPVGGDCTGAGATAACHIARWNGSSWSAISPGTYGTLRALAVFDGGFGLALYVGGSMRSSGGVPTLGLARWNGTNW